MTYFGLGLLGIFTDFGCSQSHEALIAGDENLFVGTTDDGVVRISADGVEWSEVTTGSSASLVDSVFGEGLAVVLSSTGEVLISANGHHWQRAQLDEADQWVDIDYAGGRFLAVGFTWDDGVVAHFSDDGQRWQRADGPRVRPAP